MDPIKVRKSYKIKPVTKKSGAGPHKSLKDYDRTRCSFCNQQLINNQCLDCDIENE